MYRPLVKYLSFLQGVTLLLASAFWVDVWLCPCGSTIQDAAFWTAVVISQGAVLFALRVLSLD